MPIDTYSNAILILNAVTAQKFLLSYLPDLLPTFLRCTGVGFAFSMFSVLETITIAFIDWEVSIYFDFRYSCYFIYSVYFQIAAKYYLYLIFLIFSLPGFFVLKLPDTTHADLPTVRLFRV